MEHYIYVLEACDETPGVHDMICPMCSDTEQKQFVWSDMLRRHICWLCSVELCVDFYPEPDRNSNYFLRAAELVGFSEWVCRRLYLQEILMNKAVEVDVDVELCRRQMDAINEYLTAVNESKSDADINAATIILRHKLKEKAFHCNFDELLAYLKT